jgi:hypothetical protein
MSYKGDFNAGATIRCKFNTVGTDNAPITLAGTPAVKVYKNNSTTESAAGVTLTVDFDGKTGLHHVDIDSSADGTFYAAGCEFSAEIDAGTVNGTSVVGKVICSFSIENRNIKADVTKWNSTAVATPDTAGYPKVTGKSGTGTGEWSLTSGIAKANLVQIDSLATTTGAAVLNLSHLSVSNPAGDAISITATGKGVNVNADTDLSGDAAVYLFSGSGDSLVLAGAGNSLTATGAMPAVTPAAGSITSVSFAAGAITATTVAAAAMTGKGDWPVGKTGYSLSSTGLDSVAITAPSGVASNFREMLVSLWRRAFKKSTLTATQLKTYADDGSTVLTTQAVSNDGTTQTAGTAS